LPQSGLHIEANSYPALFAGFLFVAALSWMLNAASKIMSGERQNFLRQVAVESGAAVISGIILYSLGIIDEIKLLSVPVAGGLSIAIISSIRQS
jgi:hypothetical protein